MKYSRKLLATIARECLNEQKMEIKVNYLEKVRHGLKKNGKIMFSLPLGRHHYLDKLLAKKKLGLTQSLQQKLSPQQIQFIKLLQVPTAELESRIEEELEDNPALEEGKEENDEYNEFEEIEREVNNDDLDI